MKRVAKRAAIVAGIAFALVFGFLTVERVRGKRALAKYKAELREKGENLDWRTCIPTASAEDVRKSREFYDAAKRIPRFNEAMGMLHGEYCSVPGREAVIWRLGPGSQRRTGVDWVRLKKGLSPGRESRERICDLLDPPPFCRGPYSERPFGPSSLSEDIAMQDKAAMHLADAILLDLHGSHPEEALKLLHTLARLGRMHQGDSLIFRHSVQVRAAYAHEDMIWQALQHPDLPEASLAAMQRDMEAADAMVGITRMLERERAWDVGHFADCREHGIEVAFWIWSRRGMPSLTGWERAASMLWKYAWSEQDELWYLQDMQIRIDLLRAHAHNPSWMEIGPVLKQLEVEALAMPGSRVAALVDGLRYPITKMGARNLALHSHLQKAFLTETVRGMAVIAIALERYRIRHGGYPPKIEMLIPDFLTEVPPDFMDGKPLRYRLRPNTLFPGTFTLYSVGLDGRDNGGDATIPFKGAVTGNRMWDGRDIVWPLAENDWGDGRRVLRTRTRAGPSRLQGNGASETSNHPELVGYE